MIVMHGETLWSPAPQPMDDDDDGIGVLQRKQESYALSKRPFAHIVP